MAESKPVDLCTQLLPTGQLCRGIALRNHNYCRSHISRYRLMERERRLEQAMFALHAELDTLTLPELLETLEVKLDRIRSLARAYTEARITLDAAIRRLRSDEQAPMESNACMQLLENQTPEDLDNLIK